MYLAAGHIIPGNLKIISDSRIHSIIAKGPKNWFPEQIDFQKCRKKLQHLFMNFVVVGVSESLLSVMLSRIQNYRSTYFLLFSKYQT